MNILAVLCLKLFQDLFLLSFFDLFFLFDIILRSTKYYDGDTMKYINKKRKGFTLIELIVVIAVLAVLTLLIVPNITGYIESSQKVTCQDNINTIMRAYKQTTALDTNVSLEEIVNNTDGTYFSGGAACPKSHKKYEVLYGYGIYCDEHNISSFGSLTVYDEYIAKEMADLNKKINACGANKQCIKDILSVEFRSNDILREYIFKKNGNTWETIDPETLKNAGMSGTWYYQPFFAEGSWTEILFASPNNSSSAGWNSDLYFFEGQWYKKKREYKFSLPSLNGLSTDAIRSTFNNSNNFEKVK